MRTLIGGLVGLVVAMRPDVAEACGCDPWYATTVPADGATDVPINVKIIVRNGPSASPPPGYVLRGPVGEFALELEEIESHWGHRMQVLTPTAPLVPGWRYTLDAGHPIGEISFTTSEVDDLLAPDTPEVGDISLASAELELASNCGDQFHDVDLPVLIADDVVAVDVTVIVAGSSRRYLLLPDDLALLANLNKNCGSSIAVSAGLAHQIEVRVRDLAGNLSAPVSRNVTAIGCPAAADGLCQELWSSGLAECADGYEGYDCMAIVDGPDDSRNTRGTCASAPGASLGTVIAMLFFGLRRGRRARGATRGVVLPP